MTTLFLRFPNFLKKAITLSYDDGVRQDVRFMSIINKYGIKCTFNINSGLFDIDDNLKDKMIGRMTREEVLELYSNTGHEVAVHAYTHPHLELLPNDAVAYQIIKDRENLEQMFGTVVRGMAYPYGTYSDSVVETLKNCGIVYARTTISNERFDIPKDWLRLETTCHHQNSRLNELCDKFLNLDVKGEAQMFYLWGHTYEFDNNENWFVIENFCEKMGSREDIWYATNIEIHNYVKAFNLLNFSADMSLVHNPTAIEIFFNYKNNNYSVKPGCTIKLV